MFCERLWLAIKGSATKKEYGFTVPFSEGSYSLHSQDLMND